MDVVSHIKNEISEKSYKRVNVPLGKPVYINSDLREKKFGIPSKSSDTVSQLLDRTHLQNNDEKIRLMYLKSHHHFDVGEKVNRNYHDFSAENIFGGPTPHDLTGKRVREAMDVPERPVDNEKVQIFKNRRNPQIGKVHDPIKDSLNVSPDHVFGFVELPDPHDVGFIMNKGANEIFLSQNQSAISATILQTRLKLKKGNWCKFDLIKNLLPEKCTPIELLSNLRKISFPIEDDQVCTISSACITTDDSSGLYLDTDKFVKLIDWRSKTLSQIEFDNENLKAINTARIHNGTAYQVHDDSINRKNTASWHRYGAPSVRSDLAPPRVRRVDDSKNYGDEGNAGLLISPSICETFGIYQSDLYQKRSQGEILALFEKIGSNVTKDDLEKIWSTVADDEENASFVTVSTALRG